MVKGTKNKPKCIWIDSHYYCFNEFGQMYCKSIASDGWEVDDNR